MSLSDLSAFASGRRLAFMALDGEVTEVDGRAYARAAFPAGSYVSLDPVKAEKRAEMQRAKRGARS
jgi:hypothetical protein